MRFIFLGLFAFSSITTVMANECRSPHSKRFSIHPANHPLPAFGDGFIKIKNNRPYMGFGNKNLIALIKKVTLETVTRLEKAPIVAYDPVDQNLLSEQIQDQPLKMLIGDLSTADRKLPCNHLSHHLGGKDADIGYFYRAYNSEIKNRYFRYSYHSKLKVNGRKIGGWGKPKGGHCASGEATGRLLNEAHPDWHLPSNFLFISNLLKERKVQRIFIDPIYCRLLSRYIRVQAPDLLKRFNQVVRGAANHDNHLHLRVKE